MRGVTAKRLRKIAKSIGLPESGKYVPGGPLRRSPGFRHPETGEWMEGAPIRRPAVLTECFRRAYKEAKRIYKGLPPTRLVSEDKVAQPEAPREFRHRVAESIVKYHEQPN